eukprot:1062366-Amphidinium_carterae.1
MPECFRHQARPSPQSEGQHLVGSLHDSHADPPEFRVQEQSHATPRSLAIILNSHRLVVASSQSIAGGQAPVFHAQED